MSMYMEDEEEEEYRLPPRRSSGGGGGGVFVSTNTLIFFGFLIIAFGGMAWGYVTYGDFAKAAAALEEKIENPLTETPLPLDWREVEVEGLKPEEVEKVQTFAIYQALYDVFLMGVILIGFLFLISSIQNNPMKITQGNFLNIFEKDMFGTMFGMVAIGAALFMVVQTARVGFSQELPFYMKWWYGNEYYWFDPMNMIGTVVVAAAFVALVLTNKIAVVNVGQLWNNQKDVNSKLKLFTLAFFLMYVIYSFYGTYLTSQIKKSDYFEPYLPYIFPLVVSCAISYVAYIISGDKQASIVAMLACVGLIAFREVGTTVNDYWLLNSMEFWWNAFILVLGIGVVSAFVSYATTKSTKQITRVGSSAGQLVLGRMQYAAKTPTIFAAAALGAFLFFALQLFWTTTYVLGDAIVSSVAILIMLAVQNDFGSYHPSIMTAIYSGALVTGIVWFSTVSKSSFRAAIEATG